MNYINNSHLKSHGLTPTQFKEMYPHLDTMTKEIREGKGNNKGVGAQATKISCYLKYRKKYDENPKKCKNCLKEIPYESRFKSFCNSSCSASFNNKNRVVTYSKEGLEKIREVGRINGKFKKITKSKTIHKKLCIVCQKIFETTYKNKQNKTCSYHCKNKSHALNNYRQNKTFGKCGYYNGIYCASSWELAFLIYNLDLGKDIKRCELTFKYELDGEEHLYFPDFIMEGIIYEVKGRELEDVEPKTKAVINAGYKIELIRKKEITPIIKLIKEKYSVKDITKLYD